jgi:hypothetical protein
VSADDAGGPPSAGSGRTVGRVERIVVLAGAAVCLVVTFAVWAGPAVWITLGVILAFAWLARLSVGVFYAPVALAFAVAAVASIEPGQGRLLRRVGIAVLAGLAQTGLILLLA